ncbi:MAG: hypothetical protein P8Z49_09455 [Acidobacteriota bacterium]
MGIRDWTRLLTLPALVLVLSGCAVNRKPLVFHPAPGAPRIAVARFADLRNGFDGSAPTPYALQVRIAEALVQAGYDPVLLKAGSKTPDRGYVLTGRIYRMAGPYRYGPNAGQVWLSVVLSNDGRQVFTHDYNQEVWYGGFGMDPMSLWDAQKRALELVMASLVKDVRQAVPRPGEIRAPKGVST